MSKACYEFIKDIVIPVVAAAIGGGITFLGVKYTIRNENQKAIVADRERIRPFFVVEDLHRIKIKPEEVVNIGFMDDSPRDAREDSIVFYWDPFIITNVSESIGFIDSIRIDGTGYKALERIPIKPNDSFRIKGFPLSCYVREHIISEISIEVQDRQQNRYEYPLKFELRSNSNEKNFCGKLQTNLTIAINDIDCSNYKLNGEAKHK